MSAPGSGLADLKRRLAAPAPPATPAVRPDEACDFCSTPLEPDHGHLVDLEPRALRCVCRPCALLFESEGAAGGRYRRVPERYLALGEASGPAWDLLDIPVGVAFFFINSTLDRVAGMYPSPAGATESTLPLDAWADVVAGDPILSTLAPDVEALLIRRSRTERASFIVPIDACYELVGIVRKHWRGFDGGDEARDAINRFFERVRERSEAARTTLLS
ncbi:MAG: DUF5947 family protein [Acidobacteriota bacterium]